MAFKCIVEASDHAVEMILPATQSRSSCFVLRATSLRRLWLAVLLSIFTPLLLAQDKAVDFATQSIQLAMSQEPRTLNTLHGTDQVSFFFQEHIMEGLLNRNARNQLVEGVAERWELVDTKARFWLRKNAQWSDGKPVTAHDFVFAWRTVVDPTTASEYAAIMYPVKNAAAINRGELPTTALGITALDDYTLEVELESPTGYFLQLMIFAVFYPVREDFYRAQQGRYFADIENMIFNGPFTLTQWVHGAAFRLEKNQRYWNKETVHLNLINIPYLSNDAAARFNLFKDGKTAIEDGIAGLYADQLKDALKQHMRIRAHADGSVYYFEFNQRASRIGANLNFRKAVQAIVDSQELVNKVIGIPGYIPAHSFFPTSLQGVTKKFRQEYPVKNPPLDLAAAKRYLAQAKLELALDTIPPLSILTADTEVGVLQAQYMQALLKRTLNLDLKIDVQTFKLRIDKQMSGDFDIVASGWGPDYADPMTFADMYASWNPNNRAHYVNASYDALIKIAQGTADPQTRMDAMGKAQQLLIDDAVLIPVYERVSNTVQNPKLEGVAFFQTGASMVLTHARVVE